MQSNLLAMAVAIALGTVSVNAAAAPGVYQQANGSNTSDASQRATEIEALKAQLAALQEQMAALEQRTDAQSDINVSTQENVEKLQTSSGKVEKLVNDTTFNGKMFVNLSNIDQTSNGKKTAASGTGLDVKRFYMSLTHKFDETWSANLTTDFNYVSNDGQTNLLVKKVYLQGKVSDALIFRVGSADMPWIPFVENYYGFRYVENTLTDRLKFGNSADWGMHVGGAAGEKGMFNYAASVVNGGGYKNPSRSKSVDFEGRLGISPIEGMVFAVGAYSGKLGKETEILDARHTANRTDFLAAYAKDNVRVGVEYFQAKNWNNVLTAASDAADGYSAWGSFGFKNGMSVFARYDSANPSKDLNANLDNDYYNVGLEFPIRKGIKVAAVFKQERNKDGAKIDTKTNEIGAWGEIGF